MKIYIYDALKQSIIILLDERMRDAIITKCLKELLNKKWISNKI